MVIIDFVEKVATAVEYLGANRVASRPSEASGRGEVAEPIKQRGYEGKGNDKKNWAG